jgi:capsular polysaccharide biosynthesis protein
VTFGDINISVQQATPEEAERLTSLIMSRLREEMDNETEVSFS